MILWDSKQSPASNGEVIYSWNGYVESERFFSLLLYVEKHAERLRRKYLAFIHDLGETEIQEKRLVDHLAFADGLSFWWMTPFVEKSFFKFPTGDVIRLIALEEIISSQKPHQIHLLSSRRWLHRIIRDFCKRLGISYQWQRIRECDGTTQNQIKQRMPHVIQGALSLLRHTKSTKQYRDAATNGWFKDEAVMFCGYFANVVPSEAGQFFSRYWEGLPKILRDMGIKTNWLHHNSALPADISLSSVERFNQNKQSEGFHVFLNSFSTKRVIFRVLKRWFWLISVHHRLQSVKNIFFLGRTSLSLWPLMKHFWHASLKGTFAIDALLAIELFDAALASVPRQKKGFYLYENNEWERAFIHAWKKHGHGSLFAVQHSTIRFWDLRCFFDVKTLLSTSRHACPQADHTILNGKAAWNEFIAGGTPSQNILLAEALRFSYLNSFNRNFQKNEKLKILILGDIVPDNTEKLAQLIEDALGDRPELSYALKLHPLCVLPANVLRHGAMENRALCDMVGSYDVAVATHSTSAAVDAYLAGLPVVIVLNRDELNLSPLRGHKNVRFVDSANALVDALNGISTLKTVEPLHGDFFLIDDELPRWRQLLTSTFSAK